jgi:hypothetical protein
MRQHPESKKTILDQNVPQKPIAREQLAPQIESRQGRVGLQSIGQRTRPASANVAAPDKWTTPSIPKSKKTIPDQKVPRQPITHN